MPLLFFARSFAAVLEEAVQQLSEKRHTVGEGYCSQIAQLSIPGYRSGQLARYCFGRFVGMRYAVHGADCEGGGKVMNDFDTYMEKLLDNRF